METKIAVFKGKEIRKTISNNEWWLSIVDVIKEQVYDKHFGNF